MNMQVYSAKQGEALVKAARNSIELFLINPRFDKKIVEESIAQFGEKHGIFVTLEFYPTKELRGCIGFPRAVAPLNESIVDAAIAAAFEDPRFVPVSKKELGDLTVEISVLSKPELITGGSRGRLSAIKVGRDGVIVEYGLYSGLLLPIVAVEQHWGEQELLEQACVKAGLSTNYWSQPNVNVYRFQTQVFREDSPMGNVSEVVLE
jgi:hypothetical protein